MDDLTGVETNDKALKEWVNSLNQEQREKFTNALFEVLSASGAATLAEMRSQGTKSAAAMLKAMVGLDKETRAALNYAIGVLFKSGAQSLLDDWKRESRRRRKKGRNGRRTGINKPEESIKNPAGTCIPAGFLFYRSSRK